MNAQDLKNSILQLAIKGKLVEQRKEEGSAKDLFTLRMVSGSKVSKEEKVKKERKLLDDNQEEIGLDVPKQWEWACLSDISDIYTGNSIPKAIRENKYSRVIQGYDYIATKDVEFNSEIKYDNGIKIPYDEEKFRKAYKDSILMCIEGGSAGRKIGIVDRTVCFGNKLCSFNKIIIEPKYLYYYFQSPLFLGLFKNEMTGIIGGVGVSKLRKMIIPIPPIEEQKRILGKLEELLSYVSKYDRAYTKVKNLNDDFPSNIQNSILQNAVQGQLVDQRKNEGTTEGLYQQIKKRVTEDPRLLEIKREKTPFDIPEDWMWVKLKDIIESGLRNGYSPRGVNYKTKIKNLTLTATTSGVFDKNAYKYVDIEIEHESPYWLKRNDLLIQRSNSREYVGTSCIYTGGDHEFIYPDLMIKVKVYPEISVKYIDYVLKAPFSRRYFKKNASGTSQSMPKINQTIVNNALIPLPPLEEQKRIVAKIEELQGYTKRLVKED